MIPRILTAVLLLATAAGAKDRFQQPGPVRLDHDGEKWAQKTLKRLTLEEKVGQMIVPLKQAEFFNVNSPDFIKLRDLVRRFHLGGITLTVRAEGPFLYRNQPYEAAVWTNALQEASDVPLIFSADFERGLSMRLYGGTIFPHAMAFGAAGKLDNAEAFGRITAIESRAIGVQWNWYPDTDVNSNPANPIINTRSFGEDPAQVGALSAAYIRGAHAQGMLVTAKHFPGHGDTSTDTHLSLARVDGDRQRLDAVELPPFRAAIAAGVDAVMIGHMTVPALDADPNKVATISPAIIQGVLKDKLGFQGVVVSDALDMGALTRLFNKPGQPDNGRAAVEAVKAGNDIALQPANVESAFNALVAAVKSGEIPESRIDDSVLRILRAKASVGLHKARLVDLEQVSKLVGSPESLAAGQKVAEEAITLVRDNGQLLPLKKAGTAARPQTYGQVTEAGSRLLAVIFTDDVRTEYGRTFAGELRARVPDANVMFLDARYSAAMAEKVLAAAANAQAIVVAGYVTPSAGKMVKVNGQYANSVALDPDSATLLHALLEKNAARTVVVAMGSPYLAQDFPEVQNYICAYSNAVVSDVSAAKALFGEIAIRGRLPVSIPNVAQRGSGIDRNPQVAAGGINANASPAAP